jgi:hypothetical protein
MRALFRTTVVAAVLAPIALLVVMSASAVTITQGTTGFMGSATSGAGTALRNVVTVNDPPYCTGTQLTVGGSGFIYDSASPDPNHGAVTSITIGGTPVAWYYVGSDTKLYLIVANGTTSGPIVITTPAGSYSSASLPGGILNPTDTSVQGQTPGINVVPCVSKPTIVKPTITQMKPNPVGAGKSFTIDGAGFSGTTKVTIGGKSAPFAVVQDQNIVVTAPSTAGKGLAVVVTNSAGSTTASGKLTVTAKKK